MFRTFKLHPLTTITVWGAFILAVLLGFQGSHLLTGRFAHIVDVAAGLLQIILTAIAKQHVTPVAAPHDNYGNRLVPATMRPNQRTGDYR